MYDEDSFEQWKSSTSEKIPTFHFWDITLRLEVLILIFIRSFFAHVETPEAFVPY